VGVSGMGGKATEILIPVFHHEPGLRISVE